MPETAPLIEIWPCKECKTIPTVRETAPRPQLGRRVMIGCKNCNAFVDYATRFEATNNWNIKYGEEPV